MQTPEVIEVIAPNIKRRLTGVTATIVRLVPIQARMIGIVATGPGLPGDLPHLPLWRVALLPNDRWRVWHARRNIEMILGLLLRVALRRRFRLLFTSAEQRPHGRWTNWLVARMDGVVIPTQRIAAFVHRPAVLVPHGVDTAMFCKADDPEALRRRLNLPREAVILGCFGRIRAEKGTDLLVDAALELMPARPQLHLVFAGRVTEKERGFFAAQQQKIAAAGLGERIHFVGEKSLAEIVAYYQCIDLFVAPARREGFGLTPLEAMACGVPTVAADVGAYESLIVPEVTGSIFPRGDVKALEAALAGWIDAPERRAAADPRAHVVAHHDIRAEAATLVTLYRRLIDKGTVDE